MNQHEDNVERIFFSALEKSSPHQRAAFLDAACGGDSGLQERVRELLRGHEEAQGPLDFPPTPLSGSVLAKQNAVGARIGRYKLLEQIGEGGMGIVYMAEQTEPVKRKVALKIIKPGMDTQQVVTRFEAERQALAIMDHPHIAKVLDGGATDTGHPYFVMELVRGVAITNFCDQIRLNVIERLDLFIKVCQAVQHAHQKGVIHRDLKPTNVLVTLHDGVPVPKVIDFGVAKAIDQELTERTLFTNFAQMVGTPLYMSPEQAELSGLDVDTRTDVYSLGVLLYELLTGSTPFEKETLKQANYDEIRRIIREDDPPKPSARLSTLPVNAFSTVSIQRNIDPVKLRQQVRHELDWITMKAMEKDRTRRYESASALAADLQRFLAGEPVEAHPPFWTYRLRKLVHKNKSLFATASLIFSFLLLSTIGLSLGLIRISQERSEALRQRNVARQNAERLREREGAIRSYLYAADMQLAFQAYNSGDWETARHKLLAHRPNGELADQRGFEWFYLWHLCQDESYALRGHQRAVFHTAFSPDGKLVASASRDRSVVIWDVQQAAHRTVLRDFSDDVNGVDFSADGTRLATAEENRTVRVWDWESGAELARLTDFEKPVARAFFTADQQRLVATDVDWEMKAARISLWDLATQTRRKAIDGFRALAVHREADLLAACNPNGDISLWSLSELEQQSAWPGHQTQILCAAFSADARLLATGCRSGQVKLWSLDTLAETRLPQDHAGPVRDVALSSDGRLLVSVGNDGVTRIWDVAGARPQRVLQEHHREQWAASISPDNALLAVGSDDGSIIVRNLSEMITEKRRLMETPKPLTNLAMDSTGNRLALIQRGTFEAFLIDAESGRLHAQFADPANSTCSAVCFAPDGPWLWIGNGNGLVHRWDLRTQTLEDSFELCNDKISTIVPSPDGRYLAVNSDESGRTTMITDTQTGRTIPATVQGSLDRTRTIHTVVGFLSEHLLLTKQENVVFQWDLRTLAQQPVHFSHDRWCMAEAISPDKRILATSTHDHSLHLWDVPSGRELAKLSGHRNIPRHLAFSPDGRTLASASDSGEIKLWHLPTRQHLFDLRGHTNSVRFLQFAPDGTRLFSAADTKAGGGELAVWGVSPTSRRDETVSDAK
jgi:eukaryotic-like serine/threonine-protein kinase